MGQLAGAQKCSKATLLKLIVYADRYINPIPSTVPQVGDHVAAKTFNGLHDLAMGRPARMGMAQAQEEIIRANQFAPAFEFRDSGFGRTGDDAVFPHGLELEFIL